MNMNFTDEHFFKRMLSLEKRRCERAGTRFALILIDIDELTRTLTAAAIGELAEAIGSAMRETDITGWYRRSSVIGMILTTLNGTDRTTLESVVLERTKRVLSLNLDPDQMKHIRISCHLYPEDDTVGAFCSDLVRPDFKNKHSAALKRSIDILGSLAALVLLFPLFLVIAVLIKRTSEGPVFFRQRRVGQFGREFTFLKFRSMFVNNDPTIHKEYVQNLIHKKVDGSSGAFKIKNDPRVTPIGRFIRKTSLDELPQFINVLKGEMSLVGPRPPISYELEKYSVWHRRRILEAKPGITGEWQVHGRSRTSFDDMVRMDLRYIRNQSLWLDIKILLKTPFAVLNGDGAF
jgi:exopolysaccharide biosynthesis polyprenyl glycosylphosphotransferase